MTCYLYLEPNYDNMSINVIASSLLSHICISLSSTSSNNIEDGSFLIIMNIDGMNRLISLPTYIN